MKHMENGDGSVITAQWMHLKKELGLGHYLNPTTSTLRIAWLCSSMTEVNMGYITTWSANHPQNVSDIYARRLLTVTAKRVSLMKNILKKTTD